MAIFLIAWLVWLMVGALAGGLASTIRRRGTLLHDVVIGILGAFIGGTLFSQLGPPGVTDFNPWSIVAAVVGAIIALLLIQPAFRRTTTVITSNPTPAPGEPVQMIEQDEDTDPAAVRMGGLRVPLLVLIGLIVLLPIVDVALFRLRLPNVTAAPPLFGTAGTFTNAEGQLDYLVYSPPGYQPGTPAPLLVLLHGCTQNPYLLEAAAGMRAVADANNFMIVYPEQNPVRSPHRCWNWYDRRNQQRDSGEPALIMGIVDEVTQTYSIDTTRIYVAGISSGGAMTSILASCYRDVFAAAAVHSGMGYESSTSALEALIAPLRGNQVPPEIAGRDAYACSENQERPIPVLVLHGTADIVVYPVNGEDTTKQFVQTNDLADDGEDNNSVVAQPADSATHSVEDGHTYRIESFTQGGELLMQQYVIDGLSHMWSGGTGIFPLSDPKAPNASEIFWQFMSAYQLAASNEQ